jgi:phosphoribosylamine--glycine ligase
MVRLDADLVELLYAAAAGTLERVDYGFDRRTACCVVVCSGGYPGTFEKGKPITGLEEASAVEGVTVFHAGTGRSGGNLVTTGGRVVGVTALGATLGEAQRQANAAAHAIRFDGAFFRHDIGSRVLQTAAARAGSPI